MNRELSAGPTPLTAIPEPGPRRPSWYGTDEEAAQSAFAAAAQLGVLRRRKR